MTAFFRKFGYLYFDDIFKAFKIIHKPAHFVNQCAFFLGRNLIKLRNKFTCKIISSSSRKLSRSRLKTPATGTVTADTAVAAVTADTAADVDDERTGKSRDDNENSSRQNDVSSMSEIASCSYEARKVSLDSSLRDFMTLQKPLKRFKKNL